MTFTRLIPKELRQVVRGVLYLVFVAALLLFFFSQFGDAAGRDIELAEAGEHEAYGRNVLTGPMPGEESYGSMPLEDPAQVMPGALMSLLQEYLTNDYSTYPVGFLRNVRLNDAEQQQVADVLSKITGLTPDALSENLTEWYNRSLIDLGGGAYMQDPNASAEGLFPILTDYDTFRALMAEVDDLLGGGSAYAVEDLAQYGKRELTYEEALARYEDVIEKDRITGTYARLFCDYVGIAIGMFAVFVPVAFMMRDRRVRMHELIYPRRASSTSIICARYLACLAATMVPVLLLSIVPTAQLMAYASRNGLSADPFAFLKYILGWILPTAMVCTSVGFFFTVLTDSPVGIAVQFLWTFFDFSTGPISGGTYGAHLIIRHNQTGGRHLMEAAWDALVVNRVGYALLALTLLALTIACYEMKRRGRLDVRGSIAKILRGSGHAA